MRPYKYLITEKQDFNDLLEYLHEAPIFGYDTETNGKFSQFEVQLVGMSFGFTEPDFAVYIPLQHHSGVQLDSAYVLDGLRGIFEDPLREYVAHNAKFDEMVLNVHGITPKGIGHDTMVQAWMLRRDSRDSKGLKPQVKQKFGVVMETYEDVVRSAPRKKGQAIDYNFARVSAEAALSYAADDAYWTLRLHEANIPSMRKEKILAAYKNIEQPLTRIVGEMERHGVCIDIDYINEADKRFPEIKEKVEGEIYEAAGQVFNPRSSQQLKKVLIDDLKIAKVEEIPTTDKGALSFDKDTMKMLKDRHPVVANILRAKKITKIHGTFVQGLLEKVDKDGRIHASFNPTGTETGRFSSNNPNLQQIEGDEVEGIKVRNFIKASDGCLFVGGDYSQVELRILAHLSHDDNMIDAFLSGMDFHDATARKMLELQGLAITLDEEVTPRQRFHAKSLNFGIPYGRGPGSVAGMLNVEDYCGFWPQPERDDRGDVMYHASGKMKWAFGHWGRIRFKWDEPCHECGKCFIEDWFSTFPEVLKLKEKTIAQAKHFGYVRTLSGRKRYLHAINSGNPILRSGAERQAFNTIIQGSAGDIIKLAMVALAPKLKPLNAQMVLTIHDELIVESPEERAEDVREIMRETMSHPLNGKNPISLPLKTDPHIAKVWGDVK